MQSDSVPRLPSRHQNGVTIAVMGATGTGKSTFINLISKSALKVGGSLRSCTSAVETSNQFLVDDVRVTLIDTPSFDGTSMSDTEVFKRIAAYLATLYEEGYKLSGILWLSRITDYRVGNIARKNFLIFRKLCGDNSLRNIIIITNMWPDTIGEVEEAREKQLATDERLYKPVLEKGATMMRHLNTEESARRILRSLIFNYPEVLHIQKEIVDERKDITETQACGVIDDGIEKLKKRHAEEMVELLEQMGEALREKDNEMKRELELVRKEMDERLSNVVRARAQLAEGFEIERKRLRAEMAQLNEKTLAEQREALQRRQEYEAAEQQRHERIDELKRRVERTQMDPIHAQAHLSKGFEPKRQELRAEMTQFEVAPMHLLVPEVDVYARELEYLKYGRALWFPEKCIEIGDVGMFIHNGEFIRLFNVTRPADDPSNSFGVPDGFQVLDLSTATQYRSEDRSFIQNHVLHSRSIALESCSNSGGIHPSVSGQNGALLALGSDGHMLQYRKNSIFRNYILKHYESWNKFVCELKLPLPRIQPNLILISGWIRAFSCALVCYHDDQGIFRPAKCSEYMEGKGSCVFISYNWIQNEGYRRLLPRVECVEIGPSRHKHAEIRARFTTDEEDDGSGPYTGRGSPSLSFLWSMAPTRRTRDVRVPLTIGSGTQVRLQSLYSEDGSREYGAVVYLPDTKLPTHWAEWREATYRQHISPEGIAHPNHHPQSSLSIGMFRLKSNAEHTSLVEVKAGCPTCHIQLSLSGSVDIYCSEVCEAIDVIMLIVFSQPPLMGRVAVRPFLAPVLARTTDADALDTFFTRCGGGGHSLVDLLKTCLDQVSVVVPSDAPRKMHHAVRIRLRHALARLCQLSDSLPSSLILQEIGQFEAQVVGYGGFADVYRGSYKGKTVAIKQLRANNSTTPDAMRKRFKLEVVIWKTLSHDFILPFLGVSINGSLNATRLISPWMDNGNIRHYLNRLGSQGKYNHDNIVSQIYTWIIQIITGLAYLHSEEVVHGDLRGPNVLVGPDQSCQLTDFGLSVFASSSSAQLGSLRGGNPHWLSTELLDPSHYGLTSERPTYMSDVWSFACVCIELFTNADPLSELKDFAICAQVVQYGVRPKRPSLPGGPEMITPLWEILQKCWREERTERPTVEELVPMLSGALPITLSQSGGENR